MTDRKDPRIRGRQAPTGPQPEGSAGNDGLGWEARALARVRPHLKELSGPAAAQAGWETDTITRLEDYFDRGEV